MKKFLITILVALTCILTVVAFGCTNNGNKKAPKEYTVEFMPTENLEYVCDGLDEGETTLKVKSGTTVNFSVEVPFMYDVPTVYANGDRVTAQNGVYSVVVTGNVTITTAEVKESMQTVTGLGTKESPYSISTPADYFYIADRVNEGNSYYVASYYSLENDIDFGGQEIPVIGDGVHSYFMGNFNGKGHTLSNFRINANGLTYVGVFGYLISSGSDDGTGLIVNLNIDDFEIVAQSAPRNGMFIGSFVGYSVASNVVACSATNGSISVHADDTALAYVGGAVGVQNSATISNGSTINYYPASTLYVYTDVDITRSSGGVYAAGGIVGYVYSEQERAISSVINCYSVGHVFGGICSGGITGYLGDYSSLANCYSLSEIYADTRYKGNEFYSHMYAGGLVGYLGNGSVISDSFAKNEYVECSSELGRDYMHTGDLAGGIAEATLLEREGVLFNCKYGSEVSTTENFFKNIMHWQKCDWVITDGSYPVINMAEAEVNNFTVNFDYSGKNVDGKQSRELKVSLSEESYAPMFYFYGEEFGDVVITDEGETSYGFFFDEALTLKVPYGFIPTRNITLYTGFTDYGEVAGTYYLVSGKPGRKITLTLYKNGAYGYNDGVIYTYYDSESETDKTTDEFTDFYTYDGTKIIFSNALFARLSSSVAVSSTADGSEIARPDWNYGLNKFAGKKVDGGLEICDGNYFTEDAPLIANLHALSGEWYNGTDKYVFYTNLTGELNGQSFTYTLSAENVLTINLNGSPITLNLSSLSKYDAFKGVWEVASNVNRKYIFDGVNSWTYTVKGVVKGSGTYTVGGDGVADLGSGVTAELDVSGLLLIKKDGNNEYFAKEDSFSGIWVDFDNNIIIYIDGFGNSPAGGLLINIGGATSQLTYIFDGFFDGDGKTHITLLNGYSLYGYLTCNADGSLSASFFSPNTASFLEGYNFYLLDTLEGDWIGEGEINGTTIDSLSFNGLGLYGNGSVSLNNGAGTEYELDENFDASFGDYKVSYDDEKNIITITLGSEKAELSRKDEISAYVLIGNVKISDEEAVTYKYTFNGGGNLSKGGQLIITDAHGNILAELGYKNIEGSIEKLNLKIELYSSFRGTVKVGDINIKDYKFEVKYIENKDGLPKNIAELLDATLTIDNPFTGRWSASDFYEPIIIGELDLSNSATGSFLDMTQEVTYSYLPEYGCLLVHYVPTMIDTIEPVKLYLIMLTSGNMVISSFEVLTEGDDLVYCAISDELEGKWSNIDNGQLAYTFDGMADSLFTVGIARNERGEVFFYTRRFGTYYLWSADGEIAYTLIYVKNGVIEDDSIVYRQGRFNRIVFHDFDLASSILEVKDGKTEYKFYLTHAEVDGVEKRYMLTGVNGDITTLVIYENEEDNSGTAYIINHAEKTIKAAD